MSKLYERVNDLATKRTNTYHAPSLADLASKSIGASTFFGVPTITL
jgi:hypothetical protein